MVKKSSKEALLFVLNPYKAIDELFARQ